MDGDLFAFCCGIVDAVAPHAVAVKPQSAFFEALGADGVRAFAAGLRVRACRRPARHRRREARRHRLDGARAFVGRACIPLADAVTVNPYLGGDSLEPFLEACRREGAGIFCLVKTSNPGSADVQDVELADGRQLWQHVAGLVRDWGEDSSATAACRRSARSSARRSRARWPRRASCCRARCSCFPGIGAQGGTPADVAAAFAAGPASALVSASRSVIYAYREGGGD